MDDKTPFANSPSPVTEQRRLGADVARALQATGRFAGAGVQIHAADGIVRLEGRVASYYHKQVAQTAASAVLGDCQLVNKIQVDRP